MYFGALNHLFVFIEDKEVDQCYTSLTSYKYIWCRIIVFLLNIVQLYFDLLIKLYFKDFCFQWSCNRNNVWFMKMSEFDLLFFIYPVSYDFRGYLK